MTRIRHDDIPRIAHTGMRTGHHLEHHGQTIWALTRDWQTPLTATGPGPGRDTTRPDPTGTAAITHDELRHAHTHYLAAVAAYETAADTLYTLLERYRPQTPDEIEQARKRKSTIVDCVICDGPALPRPRRGMCERCYRRYGHHPGSTGDARRAYQRDEAARQLGTG